MTGPQGARTDWPTVWLAVIAGLIVSAHVGKLPPAMPLVRADLNLGLVMGGWATSMFNLTSLLIGAVAGSLSDRIGHLRVLLTGLAALALGGVLGALADTAPPLLVGRFIEGFGFVTIIVSAPSIIVDAAHGPDRRLALGLWSTYMPAGVALMMVIAPVLLHTVGWRGLWLALAALSAAWCGVLWLARRRMPRDHGGPPPLPLARNLRIGLAAPGPWLLGLCFGVYALQWLALMVWMPSFLVEQRGMGTGDAALLTALVVAMNVPANLAAGWMLKRGARRWLLILVSSLVMAASAVGILSDVLGDGVRYGLCMLFSAVGGFIPASLLAAAPDFSPSRGQLATVNGMLIQGSNLGQFAGPPAVAAIVSVYGGWESAVWLIVAMALACAGLALLIGRAESRL
ncbi:MAG: MFS transporter [Rhodobacterales bacterium]|nr:MFS transporter [Rhodobacterales bacterium]